ncbi:MAG: hypothetical protein U0L17_05065 [Acutalibacteraceae bacterium]|nr:hypothetical protein [Acutalibacteraceae bacterium]
MNEKESVTKSLLLIVGFVTAVAAVAGAVYGVLKYFEKRKTEEFMDYYFDEDSDIDEELEAAQLDENDESEAPEEPENTEEA